MNKGVIGLLIGLLTLGITFGSKFCQTALSVTGSAVNRINDGTIIDPAEDKKTKKIEAENEENKKQLQTALDLLKQQQETINKLIQPNASATTKPPASHNGSSGVGVGSGRKVKPPPSSQLPPCHKCVSSNEAYPSRVVPTQPAPYQTPSTRSAQTERVDLSTEKHNSILGSEVASKAPPTQPPDLIREEVEVRGKKGNWFTGGVKKIFGGIKKGVTAPARLFRKK